MVLIVSLTRESSLHVAVTYMGCMKMGVNAKPVVWVSSRCPWKDICVGYKFLFLFFQFGGWEWGEEKILGRCLGWRQTF